MKSQTKLWAVSLLLVLASCGDGKKDPKTNENQETPKDTTETVDEPEPMDTLETVTIAELECQDLDGEVECSDETGVKKKYRFCEYSILSQTDCANTISGPICIACGVSSKCPTVRNVVIKGEKCTMVLRGTGSPCNPVCKGRKFYVVN